MNSSPLTSVRQSLFGRKFTLLAMRVITLVLFYLFGLGMLYAVDHFNPGQSEGFLPALVAIISIEAILTHIRTRDLDGRERNLFRLSEIITIAVFLKAFLLLQNPALNLPTELAAWQNNFVLSFLSDGYMEHLLLLLGVWTATGYFNGAF